MCSPLPWPNVHQQASKHTGAQNACKIAFGDQSIVGSLTRLCQDHEHNVGRRDHNDRGEIKRKMGKGKEWKGIRRPYRVHGNTMEEKDDAAEYDSTTVSGCIVHQHKETRWAGKATACSIPLSLCITRKGVLQSERDEGFPLVDKRRKCRSHDTKREDVAGRENEVGAAVVEWHVESKMERLAALRISNEYYPAGSLNTRRLSLFESRRVSRPPTWKA